MADRSIRVRLMADVMAYRTAMAQAGASTRDFGREISGQGTATTAHMERVGRAALTMAGVIGVGVGLAAKAALDWESAWAGVTKTVDGSASQMAALEDGLRGLAGELPATHAEIAGVAEAAGQLGIERGAILGFTETMIALGETTNLTADQAATAMARMANIMQTPQSEIDRFGSSLVALGNNSATTESEILDMATRIASAGTQIGLSEGEVLGFSAALSSVGIEAEAGGSAISRVMIETRNAVMEGGDALDTFAEVAGMTSSEFATAFRDDAGGAIISFIEGLGRMEAQGQNSNAVLQELGFADIRVGNALRSAAASGDLFRESLALGNEAWDENTALADEAEKRYQTTGAQLEVFRNKVVDLGIDIGAELLPFLVKMADVAGDVVDGFSSLPDPVKRAATALAVVSTAGLGVIGMAGTLAPKIQAGRAALEAMGAGGEIASRGIGAFGRGMGRLIPRAAGAAAGFLILDEVLDRALGDTGQYGANIDALTVSLQTFGRTGQVTGELLDVAGQDFEKLTDALADPSLIDKANDSVNSLIGTITLGAGDVDTEVEKARQRVEDFDTALADLAAVDPDAAFSILETAAEAAGISVEDLTDRLPQYAVEVERTANASATGAEGARDLAEGLEPPKTAAEEAEAAISDFNDEIDRLLGGAFDFEAASDELEQAIIDAGTHFKEQAENLGAAGLTLEGNSQAALENREVMRGLVEQSASVIAAAQAEGASVEELNLIREAEKAKLRELAARYGLNEDQVEGYIGVLDGIPISKSTSLSVTGYVDSLGRVHGIIEAINGIPERKFVNISVGLSRSDQEKLRMGVYERWGGITSYARGGIDAHVARGDLIRYAEPETGGEAYIPRLGDAARSRAVLAEAASWYGLAVVPAGGLGQVMNPAGATPAPAQPAGQPGPTTIEKLVLQTPDSPRQWLDEASWRMAGAA